jgi:hypothetical protein
MPDRSVWAIEAQILAMLETASNSRNFAFQSVETVRAAIAIYASGKADFSDCLALEVARSEGNLPFATLIQLQPGCGMRSFHGSRMSDATSRPTALLQ